MPIVEINRYSARCSAGGIAPEILSWPLHASVKLLIYISLTILQLGSIAIALVKRSLALSADPYAGRLEHGRAN